MIIITNKGQVNTDTDAVVFVFNNDDEMNTLLTKVASTPVLTSGFRVVSLIDNHTITPLQQALLDIITGLDGVGGKDTDKILDNAADSINNILNQQP